MAEFVLPILDQLRSELSYLPERRRRETVVRLEALLAEIEPTRQYTFEAIHQRITLYPPAENGSLRMMGDELLHDLHYVLEHLSGTFNVPAESLGEPVYTLEQVADMLDVSPSMVRQWRHSGLIVKRYRFGDEKESGVRESELIRFLKLRAKAGGLTTRLRLPCKTTREALCLQAEKLVRKRRMPLCILVDALAARHHLPREAVLLTLRERDKASPYDVLFPDLVHPLTRGQKWEIHEACLAGESVESLMERFDRSRVEILRVVRQVKARQILDTVSGYMPNPLYEHPNVEEIILGPNDQALPLCELAMPDFVADLTPDELLNAKQEFDLFRRYNYLKYCVAELHDSLPPSRVTAAVVEQAYCLRDAAVAVRNVIMERNARLVIRVAHRHSGRYIDINELISDGTISLMRAIEKFDYNRGTRFSTYATWALMKNFAKTVPEGNYRRERYATGQEKLLETLTAQSFDEEREAVAAAEREAAVLRAIDKLSDREREIIISHFGLTDRNPATLAQIGKRMHITRERVRQIERRALDKIKNMFSS